MAITDNEGKIQEQRQFGAWGSVDNFLDKDKNITFGASSLITRGYTGHEHFFSVGLIHMNGRMYDAHLGRFLSPDNYIQEPFNTQNFNRFGYVLNNPLKFTDRDGEIFWLIPVLIVVGFTYLKGAHDNRDANGKWNWDPFTWKSTPSIGLSATGSDNGNGGITITATPTVTPTGSDTPLPIGPSVGGDINFGRKKNNIPNPYHSANNEQFTDETPQQKDYRVNLRTSKHPIQDIFKAISVARSKKRFYNLYGIVIPNNYGDGYHQNYSETFTIYKYSYKVRVGGYSSFVPREYYNIYKGGWGYLDRFSKLPESDKYDQGYSHGFYLVGYERNILITIGARSLKGYKYLKQLYESYKK